MGVQVPLSAPDFKGLSCIERDPIYLATPGFGPYVALGRLLGRSSSNANKVLRLAGAPLETQNRTLISLDG